ERRVLGRDVARDVDDSARQDHRAEEGIAPRVAFRLRVLVQPDSGRLKEHLHHLRLWRRYQHRGVELAAEQRHHRRGLVEIGALELVALDGIGGEDPARDAGRAAAAHAGVHAPAAHLRQRGDDRVLAELFRRLGPVEDPDWIVGYRAERDEVLHLLLLVAVRRLVAVVRAALDEGDVHLLLRIAQQAAVLQRAHGGPKLHADAVALEL